MMPKKQTFLLLILLLSGLSVLLLSDDKTPANPPPLTIDQILLKKAGADKFKPISDEVFLRRTYLSIGNRIPTLEEIKKYESDTVPNKRKNLIDKLMNSPDYNEALYPFWADMLRLHSKIKGVYGEKYQEWLRKSIAQNKPYDKMVYELITASGKLYQNGAIGYYLRDEGNILETASTTSQIFLGTQIGCAQCHDHAFEDWTQKQFYEFASYMGKVTINEEGQKKEFRKEFRDEDLTTEEKALLRRIVETTSYEVKDKEKKELKFPADYKYKNAKPNETAKPHVFFGEQPILQNEDQRREAFGHWLTSKENPYFTKIIVNRLWKRVMGTALFEPIDDYNSNTKVNHPEILELLEVTMKDLNYDMKKFLTLLYNTEYYQTPASVSDTSNDKLAVTERPLLRMKAEQVWNSLLTLTRKDINEYYENDGKATISEYSNASSSDMNKLIEAIQKDGLTEENKEKLLEKMKQIDAIREAKQENGKDKKNKQTAKKGEKKETDNKEDEKKEMSKDTMKESMKDSKGDTKMESGDSMISKEDNLKQKKRLKDNLAGRASEIVSPAPEQHMLNFFGQSDRMIIEEGNLDPNLPQVLALLNSPLTTQFILKNSYIKRQVNQQKENTEKIEYLYQAILTRKPTTHESKFAVEQLVKNPKTGVEDIIWALVNSREFIFIQ